jgi:1-phosphofructokinase family hexose kinase
VIYTVTLNPSLDKTLFFPRLALGELNRAREVRLDVGGKGFNVSRALRALGPRSVAVGFVAGTTGEYLRCGLATLGIETDLVQLSDGETRANLTVAEESTGVITKLNEPGPQVSEADVKALLSRIQQRATEGDMWIMSGSVPPGTPADIYARIIGIVHRAGGRAFLDSSGAPLGEGCRAAPYGVKPNVEEASEVLGWPLRSEEDLRLAIEQLLKMDIQLVALSRGAEGALVGSQEGIVWAVPPPSVVVKSPIGAGDALLAGSVFAVNSGLDLESIACWAVATGTAAAMQEGTGMGEREEIEGLLGEVGVQRIPSHHAVSHTGSHPSVK